MYKAKIAGIQKMILGFLKATDLNKLEFVDTPNGLGEANLLVAEKGEDVRMFMVFYVEDGFVCHLHPETLEHEFTCTIDEFEDAFEGFKKLNECSKCNGTKIDQELYCKDLSNECCGGCYKDIECDCEKLFS